MKGTGLIDQGRLNLNLAIYKKGGTKFEVVVDPDLAVDFKKGNVNDVRDVLKSESIFFDAQKGMVASRDELEHAFSTCDQLEVAAEILKKGEIQLTAEHRKRLREQKKRRIIELIHRNSINPQTNAPFTRETIESALEEAKVKVDERKSADDQVETVLKALKAILPIRYEVRYVEVIVEPKFAPQSYSILKSYGQLLESEWLNDGSLIARVKLPAGLQSEFVDKLNSLTHGNVNIKVLEK